MMFIIRRKYLALAVILAMYCHYVVTADEGGITLLPPLNSATQDSTFQASEINNSSDGSSQSEGKKTEVKAEVSKFLFPEQDGGSRTLVLAKLYNIQEAMGNSYVLHVMGESMATIIDPGFNGQAIVRYLAKENLTPDAILLTNGHFIRIADNEYLKSRFENLQIAVGAADAGMLTDANENQSDSFGGIVSPPADVTLQGGEAIETSSSITWTVLSTPGFTPGSLSYQIITRDRPIVFTGDFIYRDGIGSANLPMSDPKIFDQSLQRFLEFEPSETIIYPGFGPNTTVGDFYRQISSQTEMQHGDDNVVLDEETGIFLPMDSSLALNTTVNPTLYQTTVVEVYPTTTYIFNDIWIPYYRHPRFGLSVWAWVPFRPLPAPFFWRDSFYWRDYWHGAFPYPRPWPGPRPPHFNPYDRRPSEPPPGPNRPGRPDQPNRPGRPDRPNQPGLTNRPGQSDRPDQPNRPGLTNRPDRQPVLSRPNWNTPGRPWQRPNQNRDRNSRNPGLQTLPSAPPALSTPPVPPTPPILSTPPVPPATPDRGPRPDSGRQPNRGPGSGTNRPSAGRWGGNISQASTSSSTPQSSGSPRFQATESRSRTTSSFSPTVNRTSEIRPNSGFVRSGSDGARSVNRSDRRDTPTLAPSRANNDSARSSAAPRSSGGRNDSSRDSRSRRATE